MKPWVQLALRVNFVQLVQFHLFVQCSRFIQIFGMCISYHLIFCHENLYTKIYLGHHSMHNAREDKQYSVPPKSSKIHYNQIRTSVSETLYCYFLTSIIIQFSKSFKSLIYRLHKHIKSLEYHVYGSSKQQLCN